MKRLRHPVRAIREPFGTAGLIVACVALIAALGGTALAAKGALTGKQKKEVEKIAKKFAGKPGAPGVQGSAGANGKDGANGSNGTNGANGESVTLSSAISCGSAGGTKLTVGGSSKEVCNGEEGQAGEDGEPWTAGGTLPPGATETGTWFAGLGETVQAAISFAIPVQVPITSEHIFVGSGRERKLEEANTGQPAPETEFEERCGSSFRTPSEFPIESPGAEQAGTLCIYIPNVVGIANAFVSRRSAAGGGGTGQAGGWLTIESSNPGVTYVGSFAVKGCSPDLPEGDPNKCP